MRYRAYKKSITRDMNKAINELYKNQNLMDSKIVSTLGLTDKDLELLKNNDKILDFYSSHTIDANLENINSVVRFMEYDKNNNINEFIVHEGTQRSTVSHSGGGRKGKGDEGTGN